MEITEKLTDYFYWLAFGGRGDLSRGHYFYMLFALEFGLQEELLSYRPTNPHQWLALLVDVIGHYKNTYLEGTAAKESITSLLEQTYKDFEDYLQELGLVKIATETEKMLTKYLTTKSPLHLELSKDELKELQVAEMRLIEIFEYLPELTKVTKTKAGKEKKAEKHTIGRKVLEKVRQILDTAYEQAVRTWQKERKPNFINLIASLPTSGIMATEIVNYILEIVDDYDFAVFYTLATNGPKTGKGRQWCAISPYLPTTNSSDMQVENAEVEYFELITGDSAEKKETTLAHLGLSQIFPLTIDHLDQWLKHPENFSELHAKNPWLVTVRANLNAIQSQETELRGNVIQIVKNRK